MIEKCHIKEGIVFAFHEIDSDGSDLNEGTEEKQQASAHELYAEEKFRRPQYRRIKISLDRLSWTLVLLEKSWQRTGRQHSRKELGNMLTRLQEIEIETEGIEDVFLREYIYEQLDMISAARRSLAEEVRWDIESNKKNSGIL